MKREDLVKTIVSVLADGGKGKRKTYLEVIKDLAVLVKDIIALVSSMKENKSTRDKVNAYLILKNAFLSNVTVDDYEA